jgi:hypothetical protein
MTKSVPPPARGNGLGTLARRPLVLRLHQVHLNHLASLLVSQAAGGHRHPWIRRAPSRLSLDLLLRSQSRRRCGPVVGQSPVADMDFPGLAWTMTTSKEPTQVACSGERSCSWRRSGRRGSNSRPSAWEADALPTELRPQSAWMLATQLRRRSAWPIRGENVRARLLVNSNRDAIYDQLRPRM